MCSRFNKYTYHKKCKQALEALIIKFTLFTVTSNKIAMRITADKGIQDVDGISLTVYPYRSNTLFIKHSNSKKKESNSIKELKQIHRKFIKK